MLTLFSWALPGRVRRDPIIFGPGLQSLREEFDEYGLAFWQVFLRPGTFRLAVPRGCLCSPVGSLGSESWEPRPRGRRVCTHSVCRHRQIRRPRNHTPESARKRVLVGTFWAGRWLHVALGPARLGARGRRHSRGGQHTPCPSVHPGEGGRVYPQRRWGPRPATVVLPCRVFAVGSPCFMCDDLASVWLGR